MKQIEFQLSEEMTEVIKDFRNQLDLRIKGVESIMAQKGLLGSGPQIRRISEECMEYVNECAKRILELSKVETLKNNSIDRAAFNEIILINLNPEIEYSRKLVIDKIIKILGDKSLDNILNELNYDGKTKIIIQNNILEFDKYIIELKNKKMNDKRENVKLFWSRIGAIALIISIVVTVIVALYLK